MLFCSRYYQGAWKFQAASPTCIASIPRIRCKVMWTSMRFLSVFHTMHPFVSVAISKARQSSQSSHSQTSKYLVSPIVIRQSPVNNPPASPVQHGLIHCHTSLWKNFRPSPVWCSLHPSPLPCLGGIFTSMERLCCKVRDVTWSYKDYQFSWIQLFGLRTWS